MSDSFLVFYYFDILSMIKRKNPFGFYCVTLILNLSRLISLIIILISKVCRVWFLKWHFWFPKFVAFDFSNDTFDFQNLSRLISQITLLISKICRVWFLKWHFWFPKFIAFDFSREHICRVWFLNWHFWFPKFIAFDFSNDTRVWFPKFLDFYY